MEYRGTPPGGPNVIVNIGIGRGSPSPPPPFVVALVTSQILVGVRSRAPGARRVVASGYLRAPPLLYRGRCYDRVHDTVNTVVVRVHLQKNDDLPLLEDLYISPKK